MLKDRRRSWKERIKGGLGRWFPERQIHIRTEGRVAFFRFAQGFQISAVAVLIVTAAWGGFASYSYFRHNKVVLAKDHKIANARLAYQSLIGEVAEYQKKFINITRDLEENHDLILNLVEKNASLQQSLKSVATRLEITESERLAILNARENLKGELSEIEDRMREMANRNIALKDKFNNVEGDLKVALVERNKALLDGSTMNSKNKTLESRRLKLQQTNFSLKDNLNTVEGDLKVALVERNKALFDGSPMRGEIKTLESRLLKLQQSEANSVQRLSEQTLAYIASMERIVAMAGLNVAHLLKVNNKLAVGQGGPFIPAHNDDLPANRLKISLATLHTHQMRLEKLQDVIKKLPLTVPLDAYYLTSRFGKRRDPINRRWAAHYGIDLGSSFKSKVYTTAAGVVSYAGWKGKYGKLVEVNHGAGLKTRYGHLHKIFVKKGQKVIFRQKIGLLGNTGRSTGAHLHYGIVFKGKSKNPMNFIKSGRYVFQEQ